MKPLHTILIALLSTAPALVLAQASKPAEDAALRDIEAFTTMQARSDPHFKAVEVEVVPKVDVIVSGTAPAEWLPAIRRQYFAASERLHREELERVRQSEYAVYSAIGAPTDAMRGPRLDQRFEQLTAEFEAAKIGPRELAMRQAEAARIYYGEDAALLTWRQAKVPIATAYEMGRISRDEFVERWGRATAAYDQARDSKLRDLRRAYVEEIRAIQEQSRTRTVCTSRMVMGRLQTTCQ